MVNVANSFGNRKEDYDDEEKVNDVSEEELFMCKPKLTAFNFARKEWEDIGVSLLNGIIYTRFFALL